MVKYLNFFSAILMIILGTIFIFFPLRQDYSFLPFFLNLFILIILVIFSKMLMFENKHFYMINFCIWVNLLGELYFYYNFFYYDKVLHFIIPFFITWCVYDYYKKENNKINSLFIFLIVVGISGIHEIIEFLAQSISGLNMMGVTSDSGEFLLSPLTDTILDLITNVIASITFLGGRKIWK